MKVLLAVLCATHALALPHPEPGLLRVPRVYNALVTSNQNLSPSRAFPVIQPVVHTTAVGYVPPFYYTQFAPRYPGPEIPHLLQELLPAEGAAPKDANEGAEKTSSSLANIPKRQDAGEHPLSFYPNYHSLYYDPYFYSYKGFDSHLAAPNIPPYLLDRYQPQGAYGDHRHPQPQSQPQPQAPQPKDPEQDAPREKIPDVPPPPVPTSSPNKP